MFATLLLALVCSQEVSPEVSQKPALLSRWTAALEAIAPTQRAGLEFLLEHMPPADRATLSIDLVVENVEYAYKAWQEAPWHETIKEDLFFNEILPYANINERRDRWRKDFFERFGPLVKGAKSPAEAAAILNNLVFPLVGVIYSTARPKADQSPYESIEAGMASCTGLSVLLVDACRAVGVPARFVGTPLWADGSGNHSWVEVWDDGWHFTGAAEPTGNTLDSAWFTGRASQALVDDRERAIYAVSYRQTPIALPMVWQPDAATVYAVNVTGRYLGVEDLPVGSGHLRVRFRDTSGKRLARAFHIVGIDGTVLFAGTTHNDSFDANDHTTVILPLGTAGVIHFDNEDQDGANNALAFAFQFSFDQSLLDADLSLQPRVQILAPEDLLVREYQARIRQERAAEMAAQELTLGALKMPFAYKIFGEKPAGGRSLFISMHGGGGAPKEVNDQQWENQKGLYEPAEGIYLAPRAATDTWDLWHQAHIDRFFDRLIENMIVFEDVNPDRIYLMGYSAGGDGVYQLAPRMADRFAAAAMMAGHPNETKADGLRNLPFTLHMGAEDAAYDRNKIAALWEQQLETLAASDPGGYPHFVQIHAGKGHWMDREDAVAVEWMAQYTRNLRPQKIVWLQDDVVHARFYWLQVEEPKARSRVEVERAGQVFTIISATDIKQLTIRLDASMVSFEEEVIVQYQGKELFRGKVEASIDMLRKTLQERGDPHGMFSAEIRVTLE